MRAESPAPLAPAACAWPPCEPAPCARAAVVIAAESASAHAASIDHRTSGNERECMRHTPMRIGQDLASRAATMREDVPHGRRVKGGARMSRGAAAALLLLLALITACDRDAGGSADSG